MARTGVGETKMKVGCADSSSNFIPEKLCWAALYFLYLQSKKKI